VENIHSLEMDQMSQQEKTATALAMMVLIAAMQDRMKRRAAKRRRVAARRQKKRRALWTRAWLVRRPDFGTYEHLMNELEREDSLGYKNYLRMSPEVFAEILERLTPRIQKKDTRLRKALSPGIRLAITLRYLATGNSYHSLMYEFRVAHNTISIIVRETCAAIIKEFMKEFVHTPCTKQEWQEVADGFSRRWNFHNCVGAIDGKHVAIKCPAHGGSLYFNYKHFHSVVLMAIADSSYKFLYVDVGANGAGSDSGAFLSTELFEVFDEGVVALPDPAPFPEDDTEIPFHLIADDAFALRSWLMKPYPQRGLTYRQRIFNYRLSRARRVVENAFGILSHRFRCMLSPMQQTPKTVGLITLACCVLHNLLLTRNPAQAVDVDREDADTDATWRSDPVLAEMMAQAGNTGTRAGKAQRDYLAEYYSTVGSVPWQDTKI
jgi:hypothetical protein